MFSSPPSSRGSRLVSQWMSLPLSARASHYLLVMDQWHIVLLTRSHPLRFSLKRTQKSEKKCHILTNGNGPIWRIVPLTLHTSYPIQSSLLKCCSKLRNICSILLSTAMWTADSNLWRSFWCMWTNTTVMKEISTLFCPKGVAGMIDQICCAKFSLDINDNSVPGSCQISLHELTSFRCAVPW